MSTHALLTGPDAPALVRGVLASRGLRPGGEVEIRRVYHRPGLETSVVYSAGTDRLVVITDADVTGRLTAFTHAGVSLRGWVHPDDPRLPSLRSALHAADLREWLLDAGVRPGRVRTPELLSYRPLRRAVVRAEVGAERYFVKVVRPDRFTAVLDRHQALDAAGVGPHVAAQPAAGVLVLASAAGRSLAEQFSAWNAGQAELPDAAEVLRLLDRLPRALLAFKARPSWSDRTDFHAESAAAMVPAQAGEIRALGRTISQVLGDLPQGPPVPTHGDFYEANVFCDGPRLTQVIDVDTAGPGRRADDIACLLGHLAVLPDLAPTHYGRVAEVTHAWASEFERELDAVELRARTAAVILSLVAGTTPAHALARLDLARAWLYRALA